MEAVTFAGNRRTIDSFSQKRQPDYWGCRHETCYMCVRAIIDASAFRHLLESTPKTAGKQFREWILREDGLVVHTKEAEYKIELEKNSDVCKLLADYRQRGRVELIDDAQVQWHKDQLTSRPTRRSNDLHILALAAASQATVLFSCDSNLQNDFANPDVFTNVGRFRRRSVPLRANKPEDITDESKRRKFFNRYKCTTRQ